jgi:hypothetical protein
LKVRRRERRSLPGLSATLAKSPDEPVRFILGDGLEVHVRERGIVGGGALEGRAVSYLREGGASFWMASEGGFKEWLRLDPGVTSPDRAAAVRLARSTPPCFSRTVTSSLRAAVWASAAQQW